MKIRFYSADEQGHFPIYLSTIDINHIQEKVSRPDGYEMHQLFLVSSGNGIIEIDGHKTIISANDMFFIPQKHPHKYYGTSNDFKTTFISFWGSGFDGIKSYYNLENSAVYTGRNHSRFLSIIMDIYENFENLNTSSICANTFSAIIAFFDEVCQEEYTPLDLVHKYLEENFSLPITLNELLSFYPHSKAKLCRDFKQCYQKTIFETLTEIRLKHANYILINYPNNKLINIAESCGFNDTSYFCKMYKRYYGHSPKTILKNNPF